MKQMIVMIAMIALGVVIGGFVMGFGDIAEDLTSAAKADLTYEKIMGD